MGFSKLVRASTDTEYLTDTSVRPGGSYQYRLRYATPTAGGDTSRVVIYDVLEQGHGPNQHWRGILTDIDYSHPRSLGIGVVIYYSTVSGLNPQGNAAHANLANAAIWSTTAPTDRSTITAVAIDLSTDINGQPFIFAAASGTVVTLHLEAPHGIEPGLLAYNYAQLARHRAPVVGGTPVDMGIIQSAPVTTVTMLDRDITIAKSSNPTSGTEAIPQEVIGGSALSYTIVATNDEEASVPQVVLTDTIPTGLTIDTANIEGFFGTQPPQPLSEIARISYNISGNTINWTIATLGAGETFTLVVPTTVQTNLTSRTVFANQARITSLADITYNITSNTTWHVADALPATTTLNISKTVTAGLADTSKEFSFSVVVNAPASVIAQATVTGNLPVTYSAQRRGAGGIVLETLTFESGVAQTVLLTHGQSLVFSAIHIGSTYTVIEAGVAQYSPRVVITTAGIETATIAAPTPETDNYTLSTGTQNVGAGTNSAAFTNTHLFTPPAGLVTSVVGQAAVIVALAGLSLLGLSVRRKKVAALDELSG